MKIVKFQKSDFPIVKEIYQQGIDTGNATFQTKAKNWQDWDASLLPNCRFVAKKIILLLVGPHYQPFQIGAFMRALRR